MFFERIACLKLKGCGLVFGDFRVLDSIATVASGMILNGQKKHKLKTEQLDGLVTNQSKIGILNNIVGHVFTIEIEADDVNRVSMDFILTRPLDEEELKHTFWVAQMLDEKQEKAVYN